MPNKLLVLLLLTAMISSNLSRFFVYAGFQANRSYITANLCVNKTKPWLHCNGRCYLAQKIKQTEEKEKKQERENQKNRHNEVLTAVLVIKPCCKLIPAISYPNYSVQYPVDLRFSIFHPPPVA